MQTAIEFFFEHAGFSHDPQTETEDQGKARCARELATAERDAASAGIQFHWRQDEDCVYDLESPGVYWLCSAIDQDGHCLASLGGIDLTTSPYANGCGYLGEPVVRKRDPYCRVVEAELAEEALVGV